MNEPIYYVGGSKGGVGKSKMCFALIDYLRDEGKKVLLLESDTSNPDVFKAHHSHADADLVCKENSLDTAEGWIELVNVCSEYPNHHVVINSAARSNTGIEKYGAMLRETLPELDRKLTTFWMINRQRDSLELVRSFMNAFPEALIHICRNLYFGPAAKFELYNGSKSKGVIEARGMTLDFPDLADRVADKLYSGRTPIKVALKELPIGDRAELRRWKNACKDMFCTALGGE